MTEGHLRVAVIGAGVSGLVCAKTLLNQSRSNEQSIKVDLIESSHHVGGRVATDRRSDGYLLDRGFQILIQSYPEIRRQLNLKALEIRSFGQGAVLMCPNYENTRTDPQVGVQSSSLPDRATEKHIFANPLTSPEYILQTSKLVVNRWGLRQTLLDVCKLGWHVVLPSWVRYLGKPYTSLKKRWGLNVLPENTDKGELGQAHPSDIKKRAAESSSSKTTESFLLDRVQLKSPFYSEFLDPFFQAIYVSPLSSQHPAMFDFVLRMLAVPGSAALPKRGIQAIPEQLLQSSIDLSKSSETTDRAFHPRLGCSVKSVERVASGDNSGSRASGVIVKFADGSTENFDGVVIATDCSQALALTKRTADSSKTSDYSVDQIPTTSSDTWYFGLPKDKLPVPEPLIVLNVDNRTPSGLHNGGALQTPLLAEHEKDFRICNVGFPSVVQSSYAPPGFHLAAVTVMWKKNPGKKDAGTSWPDESWVRSELARLFSSSDVKDPKIWKLLERVSIPFHQPAQAPDTLERLIAANEGEMDGNADSRIVFSGDWRGTPTLDGAMLTGRLAAENLLERISRS